MNDGNFGVTGEVQSINPEEIELVENHKFEKINTIFWRNSNLNFKNKTSLVISLDEKPRKSWLKRIYECEDEKVLKYLINNENEIIIEDDEKFKTSLGMLSNTRFC